MVQRICWRKMILPVAIVASFCACKDRGNLSTVAEAASAAGQAVDLTALAKVPAPIVSVAATIAAASQAELISYCLESNVNDVKTYIFSYTDENLASGGGCGTHSGIRIQTQKDVLSRIEIIDL